MQIQLIDLEGQHYWWAKVPAETLTKHPLIVFRSRFFLKSKANRYQQIRLVPLEALIEAA